MRVTTRVVILIAIIASLFSFAKFSHCEKSNWAGPDQYIHACYSDLPALYSERGLSKLTSVFSGGDQAIEYPALQSFIMWSSAKLVPDGAVSYFNISVIFIALLFIGSALIIHRMRPDKSLIYILAPTGIASLYINWDLWAIVTMLLAIYWFDRGEDSSSAFILGVSIATKFFPIVLLLPIAIIYLRRAKVREFAKYLAISLGTFIAFNLPFALTTPGGWWRFYELNLHREADWGSLWYALSVFGVDLSHINYFSILLLAIGIFLTTLFMLQTREILTLSQSALFIFIVLMSVSKVYSPQYVLWLTPLALLALTDNRDLSWFWGWQITEIIYHVAIWQHLALLTGAHFGLPVKLYAGAALLRIAASIALAIAFARRHHSSGLLPVERWPELPQ